MNGRGRTIVQEITTLPANADTPTTLNRESSHALASPSEARNAPFESRIVIEGGRRLVGTIPISGSKNAALALMAGSLLASEGTVTLHNLPCVSDIEALASLMRSVGAKVTFFDGGHTAVVDASEVNHFEPEATLAAQLRGSLHLMGPVLGRVGRVRCAQPGGCQIGARPVDQHVKGLTALGAFVDEGHGALYAEAPPDGLHGTSVYLDVASVGATMNILMAAALASGETIIDNAAQEPDIEDLANLIVKMGGKVKGQGTGLLTVTGVEKLHGCEYTVMPDRIEVGTYAMAAGITGGDLLLKGANADHVRSILLKLKEVGMEVEEQEDGIRVAHPGPGVRLQATTVTTQPHPGFPTDLQQPFGALLALAEGTSVLTDKVYEGRYRYLEELRKMGIKSKVDGRTAVITGVESLSGADVESTDLRGGAAMVLAGLAAEGQTRVFKLNHVDRGYERFVEKLAAVGATIWREDERGVRLPLRRE
jgi:UDP-N-acetylglucosamine 1-carboxyvinyltransferase